MSFLQSIIDNIVESASFDLPFGAGTCGNWDVGETRSDWDSSMVIAGTTLVVALGDMVQKEVAVLNFM